jgi:alkylation response protein AidB-like acyl-CoA dehydrogenase
VIETQASRFFTYGLCQQLDRVTENGDWTMYEADPGARPRTPYIWWGIAAKEKACRVASETADSMFHLFGGAAYSRRNEIERVLRDSRAGWIMGPTNEVARGIVGRWALGGYQAVDWWNQRVNEGLLNSELGKLDADGKRAIIDKLSAELGAGG